MIEFGLGAASGFKEVKLDQVLLWACGNLFFPFGLPKTIVVDTDGLFYGTCKKTFQETLIVPVHVLARDNQNEIRNEGFFQYLNKV